ncbi:MAG: 50S ribosomal protein L5 [Candidatus Zambryskibacteria bacterium CG_4_9_14_3_um_filter_40_16]|uniref:Large ribosomal subunit protein uL5 n=2 Tax=Candidatus Zambryskiibacteriota TaxID=1817925 RepID=A0A2H0K863_9BACT|nr:MAG: 50S ribosomal protein L5 [Candidatus Zambryskibacteria bacterium CG11_big_fil_rev_8_21_14_0_20_40_24]PJA33734.1 MAG: 50S ribosomal protein L5 [Candidatus Zambryskibacteria bacterium CG_4_9_14_3_um_filter_40_16]
MEPIQKKIKNTFEALKGKMGYKNPMQAPRITKVVVNVGTGSFKDPKKKELALDRLSKITGQKPSLRGAKQSVAAFKVRQGDPVGLQVTLRGKRMYDFLDKLINIALPRTKDFRGVSSKAIDEMGNYTLGIKEHTIFPETSDEELKDVFGLSVTIVSSSRNKEETRLFMNHLLFPFKKTEDKALN